MPIAALSPGTVSAIGSTQGLSDSASLVKELIDNAIDAGATVISVEVSVNTLDDIRVKDNGHGVAPEDRSMMCTRHCTSKIRDLKDLHNIGGHSLGFRGEALASAAELSGSLTISTRIEGEPTAAEIAFSRHGQISREKRTSLPIGTIVRVEKFLETLPVRQQTAMKTSIKTLAKMRRTLQAYVLARPHLCLSLKILKAKSDKDNWKFPKTGQLGSSKVTATPINAAIDILGKKVIDQCDWKISTLSSAEGETGAYTFEAVLAKNDCDGAIISNVGQFISVDSRPVSLKRTFKQIVSRYKSAVRSKGASDDRSKVVDPLLFMNIVCPTGSYDVNVEPAKDDVLFANPDLVLRLVDMFFRTIYGDPQPDMPKVRLSSTPMIHGTELMLARKRTPVKDTSPPPRLPATSKPPARSHDLNLREGRHLNTGLDAEPTSPIVTASSTNLDRTETPSESTPATNPSSPTMPVTSREVLRQPLLLSRPSTKPTWTPSMYAEDEDDMEELERVLNASVQPPLDGNVEEDTALRNVHVSNPWVMAKLNAPFRTPLSAQFHHERNHPLPTPGRQTGDAVAYTDLSSDGVIHDVNETAIGMPTPEQSRCQDYEEPVDISRDPFPFPQKARGPRRATETPTRPRSSPGDTYRRGALDTWVQRSLNSSAEPLGEAAVTEADLEPEGFRRCGDFVSARTIPQGIALGEIPETPQRPRKRPAPRTLPQGAARRPSVPSVNDLERVWFDTGDRSSRKSSRHACPVKEPRKSGEAHSLMLRDDEIEETRCQDEAYFERLVHPDLAITMDYEARKQQAELQHRESLRRMAAAKKRDTELATDEARNAAGAPPNARNSPYKNRQSKAKAALHDGDETGGQDTQNENTFEENDPRAYLLRVQEREAAAQNAGPNAPRVKRRKTTMLPFESMHEDNHTCGLTLTSKVISSDLEKRVERSALHDQYIREGEEVEGLSSPSTQQIGYWGLVLKALVKASYRIEGMRPEEEMDGNLDVDLDDTLRKHAVQCAELEAEERAMMEGQASQMSIVG